MHTKILFIGLALFLVAFGIPVREGMYGYDFALFPFTGNYSDLSDIAFGFLSAITNVAVLVTLVTYFKAPSLRWVSILNLAGIGAAVYWMIDVGDETEVTPYATLTWMIGSMLISLAYELKKRQVSKVS